MSTTVSCVVSCSWFFPQSEKKGGLAHGIRTPVRLGRNAGSAFTRLGVRQRLRHSGSMGQYVCSIEAMRFGRGLLQPFPSPFLNCSPDISAKQSKFLSFPGCCYRNRRLWRVPVSFCDVDAEKLPDGGFRSLLKEETKQQVILLIELFTRGRIPVDCNGRLGRSPEKRQVRGYAFDRTVSCQRVSGKNRSGGP